MASRVAWASHKREELLAAKLFIPSFTRPKIGWDVWDVTQVPIRPIVVFAVYTSHTSNTLHLATRSSFYYFHPPITYDSKASGAFPSVTSFLFDSSNILFSAT